MTLSQLATFITTKLSDTDSSSVTACKDFINRRYQMIWDSAIWNETLGITEKSISAGSLAVSLDQPPSVTFFHSGSAPTTYVDFPVAVKFTPSSQSDGVELPVSDWMRFFQLDPNIWNNIESRRALPIGIISLPKDGSGYPRIFPVPQPDSAGTLYVLGKLKWVALGDSDTPCLRGIDNALLAYAEGDMLERGRQYGKAQAKYNEGAAHLQVMRDIEKGQQQSISSITPMEEGVYCPVVPQ